MHHRTRYRRVAIVLSVALAVAACRPEVVSPEPTLTPTPSRDPSATPASTATTPSPSSTSSIAPAQGARWTRIEPAEAGPAARAGHSWTVDPSSAVAYLFGGRGDDGDHGDLWAYDMTADAWQRLLPAGPAPTARSGHVAGWMDGIGLVVFGGSATVATSAELWAYDPGANAWRILAPSAGAPAPRSGACAALDPAGRLWVTHGEAAGGELLADTWVYDSATSVWQDATAASGPAARTGSACWWSPDESFTLFGGRSADGLPLADAWSRMDSASRQWSPGPALAAPGRHTAALAASTSAAQFMGGQGTDGVLLDDLVSYDLSTRKLGRFIADGDGPAARLGSALVDDPEGERLLLFGGRTASGAGADLWSVTVP